jgi:hypothetical protein
MMTYTIFRRLETGELLRVATRDDLSEAEQLAQSLHEFWPADYSVLDSRSAAEAEMRTKSSPSHAASGGSRNAQTASRLPSPRDNWEIT